MRETDPGERPASGAIVRRLRHAVGLLLGAAAALLLLATLLGLAGALWPDLDVVNHFRPYLLLAALLCLAASRAAPPGRRSGLALVAAASLAVQAWFVVPVFLAGTGGRAAAAGGALTLVTANLRYANRNMEPVVAFLRDAEPDLVFLQEVAPASLEALQAGLADRYPYARHCVTRRYCNLAILSRRPLREAAASYLGWRRQEALPRPAGDGWQRVDAALPDDGRPAAALQAWTELRGGAALRLLNVHLSWPVPARVQRGQFRWIARRVAELPPGPAILAGDFNATPWSFGLADFEAGLPLRRASPGIFSFPTPGVFPLPLVAIDQVFLSEGLLARSVTRGPDVGSDHYPLIARLALPAE